MGGEIQSVIDLSRGKKKRRGPAEPTPSELQADLAAQLFEQTDPLRLGLIARSQGFLEGGDVTETPAYADLQVQTGRAFNRAKDNLISRIAPGGGLIDALAGIESSRASALSSGASALESDELNRALALGTGATGISLGALGQAGNVQAMLAQANATRDAAEKAGMGQAAGAYLGGKG